MYEVALFRNLISKIELMRAQYADSDMEINEFDPYGMCVHFNDHNINTGVSLEYPANSAYNAINSDTITKKTAYVYLIRTADPSTNRPITITQNACNRLNNNTTPYCMLVDEIGNLKPVIYLWDKIIRAPQLSKLDAEECRACYANFHAVYYNLISFFYPTIPSIKVFAANLAAATMKELGIPFLPVDICTVNKCNEKVAEMIYDYYDGKDHKFQSIPWAI